MVALNTLITFVVVAIIFGCHYRRFIRHPGNDRDCYLSRLVLI